MASVRPEQIPPSSEDPTSIDVGAMENLRYIRDTIEAAHEFTSVPGKGCIAMGATGFVAAALTSISSLAPYWIWIWPGAAIIATFLAAIFLLGKAKRQGLSLWRGVAQRFFLTLLPGLLAGAVLTVGLYRSGTHELIAGVWLLLYGASLAASGVFSIRVVMVAGFSFMLLGTLALIGPASWSTALLAVGFGGIHVVLGTVIWRRHGG